MANLAVMNSLDAVRWMTLPEYLILIGGWNKAHESPDDPVEPPDPEVWERNKARLRSDPAMTTVMDGNGDDRGRC